MNRKIQAHRLMPFFKVLAETCRRTKRQRKDFYSFPSSFFVRVGFHSKAVPCLGHFSQECEPHLRSGVICRDVEMEKGDGVSLGAESVSLSYLLQNELYPCQGSGLRLLSSRPSFWSHPGDLCYLADPISTAFLEAFVGLEMPKLSSSLFWEIRQWTHLGVQSQTDLLPL